MTITTERLREIAEDGFLAHGESKELARALLAAREAVPVAGESGASLQLRGLIRQRHAKWSEETFGHVGPVGPLKHLSKEALEAAAEPDDLSEWADIQFLMWDAQRRAGISDAEITAAMEEKLKVNMARQWPEPKDGEPRLHITAPPAPAVPPGYKLVPVIPTFEMVQAARKYHGGDNYLPASLYRAMLAAAPEDANNE